MTTYRIEPDDGPYFSPLNIRGVTVAAGDYTIALDDGATVEIKRCVRADGDRTWSAGSVVDVVGGSFTVDAVTDRNLMLDVTVTSDDPITVCTITEVG